MELKELGTEVGLTWCSECQYKRRCEECAFSKQGVGFIRKEAMQWFADTLVETILSRPDYKIDIGALNKVIAEILHEKC